MIMTREFSFISKHHNCVAGEPGNDIFLFGIQCSDSIGWRERKKKKRTSRKSGRLVVSSKDKIFASA